MNALLRLALLARSEGKKSAVQSRNQCARKQQQNLECLLGRVTLSNGHDLGSSHADVVLEVNGRRVHLDDGGWILRKSLSNRLSSEDVSTSGKSNEDFSPYAEKTNDVVDKRIDF